jgi:hypothetical protein
MDYQIHWQAEVDVADRKSSLIKSHKGLESQLARGGLVRGVVYDEIRVVVLPDWDRNDPSCCCRLAK